MEWAGNVSQRSQREFPNKQGSPKLTCLQQKHAPPCIFTCGLQISRALCACSAGAIACSLPSLAGIVPGVWLENSASRKLHSHTWIFFPCSVFSVDHFQWPIYVALHLRHGLFSLAQSDQEWKVSSISCIALENMFFMNNTNSFYLLPPHSPFFILVSTCLVVCTRDCFYHCYLQPFHLLVLSSTQNEMEMKGKSWKRWGKGNKLNTYFLFRFNKFSCFLDTGRTSSP